MFKWLWNSFIQYLTIIRYFSMGKLCLNTANSSIFVYTCCAILTCIIHVFGKDATCIQSFYWFFIDVFCVYVDFYFLSFRHFNTEPMTLPTDDMWQCHPYVGQCMKVGTKVIPHTKSYLYFLSFRGDVIHTSVLGVHVR